MRLYHSGDRGEPVRDIQRRLTGLGFPVTADGTYGPKTVAVVCQFQESRGLPADGIVGPETWSSLVEAGFRLGDRMLYRRSPMMRGDDVSRLRPDARRALLQLDPRSAGARRACRASAARTIWSVKPAPSGTAPGSGPLPFETGPPRSRRSGTPWFRRPAGRSRPAAACRRTARCRRRGRRCIPPACAPRSPRRGPPARP